MKGDLGPLENGSLPSDGPALLLRGVAAADAAGPVSSVASRVSHREGREPLAPPTRSSRRPTPFRPDPTHNPWSVHGFLSVVSVFWNGRGAAHITL